jgi:hypothetical protein
MISVISDCVLATVRALGLVALGLPLEFPVDVVIIRLLP